MWVADWVVVTMVGLGCDYGGCAIGLVDLTVVVTCLWVNLVVMGIFGDSGYFAVVNLGMGFLIWVFVFSNLDLEEISFFWLWVFGWLVGGGLVVIGVRF